VAIGGLRSDPLYSLRGGFHDRAACAKIAQRPLL
jgi:hypothetical protein